MVTSEICMGIHCLGDTRFPMTPERAGALSLSSGKRLQQGLSKAIGGSKLTDGFATAGTDTNC